MNHERIHRLCGGEGLSIRTRTPRRRRACRYRSARSEIGGANDALAMDFVADRLFDERPFARHAPRTDGGPWLALTIVDCCTRDALGATPRTNFRAYQVVDELDHLCRLRGRPRSIRVDDGPEFAGRLLDRRAYLNRVELDFSRPGEPGDNAFIEPSGGRLRQECLNASRFLSMGDARARIGAWRGDHNQDRPHSALGGLTLAAFADQLKPARKVV